MVSIFKPSSSTRRRPHESFSETLLADAVDAAEAVIKQWVLPVLQEDSVSSPSCSLYSLFSPENRDEARRFIKAIRSLQYAIQTVTSVNPASKKLYRAKNLIRLAMKYLQREFCRILKWNRQYLDPESVSVRSSRASGSSTPRSSSGSALDSKAEGEFISDDLKSESDKGAEDADVMEILKMIADCMLSSGYDMKCVKIYTKIRKSIIVNSLARLGFQNLSFAKIQKLGWESLETKIKTWLRTVRVAVTSLFYGERILCDHVFSSSSSVRESSFAEITLGNALSLFHFPESVAKCRLSPEKVFLTLDVYQEISYLFPQIQSVFSYDSTTAARSQVIESLSKLGESVRSMVAEFEASISIESSKSLIPGGGVHQLTKYVMNFIVFLADYSDALAGIITTETTLTLPEDYFGNVGDDTTGSSAVAPSPMAKRLAWLILVLLCKIDNKARLYDGVALSYLFLANNLNYISIKVRESNLRNVLGEVWLTKQEAKVRQFVGKCERMAWGDVMRSLAGDPGEEEWAVRFNEAFETAYMTQSSWVVPDPKLRDDIKVSAAKMLIPAYSVFYRNHRVGSWENVIFTPEDLENYLSHLYLGSAGCILPAKSSQSHRFRR